MIEKEVIYPIIDEFEAKNKITDIILMGDGAIQRIEIEDEVEELPEFDLEDE